MSDDNWFTVASKSPYLPLVAGLVRDLLKLAAALGFSWGLLVTGDQATMGATAALALAMLLWSRWKQFSAQQAARRAQVAAAVASAVVGIPVTVIETQPGKDNIATRIPTKETLAAPTVPANATPKPAPRA